MIELFWTLEVIQDRDEIYDYTKADNPAADLGASISCLKRRSIGWSIILGRGPPGRIADQCFLHRSVEPMSPTVALGRYLGVWLVATHRSRPAAQAFG